MNLKLVTLIIANLPFWPVSTGLLKSKCSISEYWLAIAPSGLPLIDSPSEFVRPACSFECIYMDRPVAPLRLVAWFCENADIWKWTINSRSTKMYNFLTQSKISLHDRIWCTLNRILPNQKWENSSKIMIWTLRRDILQLWWKLFMFTEELSFSKVVM